MLKDFDAAEHADPTDPWQAARLLPCRDAGALVLLPRQRHRVDGVTNSIIQNPESAIWADRVSSRGFRV